ncbi:MAG: translation initiation factor IF-2 associated domain-containing protein, partial [Pseudomonadota bacterium]
MTEVTVKQLADVVGTPVNRLLEQLEEAGLPISKADDKITDKEKMQLLDHLSQTHGKFSNGDASRKITLKRKSISELKISTSHGRAVKTVNVEVRKKRTYIKRSSMLQEEEQARKEQEEQLRKEQEEQLRKEQEEQLRKEQEEQLRKEQEEQLRKEQEEQVLQTQKVAEQGEAKDEPRVKTEQQARRKAEEEQARRKAEEEQARR